MHDYNKNVSLRALHSDLNTAVFPLDEGVICKSQGGNLMHRVITYLKSLGKGSMFGLI